MEKSGQEDVTAPDLSKAHNDVELIQAFHEGNEKAFDRLVRKHQKPVLTLCLRMLGDQSDANDAAQDIFIKVYHSLHKFNPEAKFTTWLHRIAVNQCLNVLRSRRRRLWLTPFSRQLDNAHYFVAHGGRSPLENVAGLEEEKALKWALGKLKDKYRVALVLHNYQGLSYKEIAEIQGCSLSAVESRIHRAKLKMAELLKDFFDK